jgi:hypothetical protein
MPHRQLPLVVFAAVIVFGNGLLGCRNTSPAPYAPVDTMGTSPGRSGTGGRTGRGGSGGAKAAGGAGGGTMASAPDASNADLASDAVNSSDVASDAQVVISDAAGPVEVGAPDAVVDARADGRADAQTDATRSGPAACHTNSRVIAICHQLESACLNCPGGAMGKVVTDCFAAVRRGNDAACAKYAVDQKCTIDNGGNVCGSLNCGNGVGPAVAPGCNKAACTKAQGEGNSSMCQPLLAACPCR